MFLDVEGTIAVARVAFEEVVLSRLLLHKQSQVGRHEVDASLDTQFLADETRFEDSLLLIISAKEFGDDRLHVAHLRLGKPFKLAGVEVWAAGILDSLLAEIALQRVGETVLGMVDKVVEGTPCEVTEQDVFAVLPFFQPVEREEQRVVAVVLEAGGDGGNVQQIVGFDDDEARDQTLILPMAVEEVERHALL